MFKCLEVFGFGPSLTGWVQTFYNNMTSCIINKGTLSESRGEAGRSSLPLLVYHRY